MPDAIKRSAGIRAGGITCGGRPENEEGCAVVVASDDFWKSSIANRKWHADIETAMPRTALVVRNGNVRMAVAANVAKVNASF